MMKNQKFKLALAAMVLGIGGAFATAQPHRLTDHKWARNPITGVYTDITGEKKGTDYNCDPGTTVCTATYPAGQNPNSNPGSPLSVETGSFN